MSLWTNRHWLVPFYLSAVAELGAGGGGGGATPSPTPTGGGTPTPSPTPTGTAPDVKWLGETPDPIAVGYVQTKGWKDPAQLLDSYRNLEKLVGENRIAVPKDEKDEAAWAKLYDSMGRPKSAAEYKLPVPDGQDGKFATVAADVFHKAGLSAKQAQSIASWWNETTVKAEAEQKQVRETKQAQEVDQVKTEWGGAYGERLAIAQRGMRTFGIDGDTATKLEETMGSKWLMDFTYRIGHALTEHAAAGGDGATTPGALTPQQALAEISRLKTDTEWSKKYLNKDATAVARMEQLHKWAYPAG